MWVVGGESPAPAPAGATWIAGTGPRHKIKAAAAASELCDLGHFRRPPVAESC